MVDNSAELKRRYKNSLLTPWSKQQDVDPQIITEAHGVYLTTDKGQRLLDMKSQSFHANLGHAHQGMIKAIGTAAQSARVLSFDSFCPDRLGLAEDLQRIAPKTASHQLSKSFFTLGGAEANENAVKIARMFTGRHKIITRYRSYHGATIATMNFSGDYRRIPIDNSITGVIRFPDPYPRGSGQVIDTVRLLQEIIEVEGPETIAAIMLEGITGANGVFIPPPDYWSRIRKLCDDFGIALIADEVLSGFWRTGRWFGIDHFDVAPDIMTLSKGITGGYLPLGAVMVSPAIADYFNQETLWCGLTQYGHPLSCAAARAAIGFYESDKIGDNVLARGQELSDGLKNLSKQHEIIAETRSIGLLAAIDLGRIGDKNQALVPYRAHGEALKPTAILQKALLAEGISTLVRYSTIILAPPLVITAQELKEGLTAVGRALTTLREKLSLAIIS